MKHRFNTFRRGLVAAAAVLAASAVLPTMAQAQAADNWPSRPVTLVVPYGPGGINDLAARLLADQLQKRLGQSFVVDNRNGASGAVGTRAVIRSAADGYTLLFANNAVMGIVPVLKPSYDIAETTAIARMFITPQMLAVPDTLPVRTVPEFVAYAKKNPGKLNYGSAGVGSFGNFSGELFKLMTNTDIVHVPQSSSGKGVIELMAGRLDMMIDPAVLAQSKTGKIRVLATTGKQRFAGLPDVPTMKEAGGPDIDLMGWLGIVGPAKLPADVVRKLEAALRDIAADPAFQKAVLPQGIAVSFTDAKELQNSITSDLSTYKRIKDSAKIIAE